MHRFRLLRHGLRPRAAALVAGLVLVAGACAPGADDAEIAALNQRVQALADDASALTADREAAMRDLDAARAQLAALAAAPDVDLEAGFADAPVARAVMIDRAGEEVGDAVFWPASGGVLMRLSIDGLPSGFKGMHLHAGGACDTDGGFTSAGAHLMAAAAPHGLMHPEGPHGGDLPNLYIDSMGRALVEVYTTLAALDDGPMGLFDADTASLMVHEGLDDHVTQPIGGSGARIACGVIQAIAAPTSDSE